MSAHAEKLTADTQPAFDDRNRGTGDADDLHRATHRHVILVVEDSVDLRDAMQALLTLEGFDLLTAADGAEAVQVLRREPAPCLILLDLMMPVSDGRDFRRHQLQDPRLAAIPTVLFSAHDGIAQRASELGITAFIPKPADFDTLAAVVAGQCIACGGTPTGDAG